MDYAKFQIAVVELADGGTPLTEANVVARLRVEPAEVERHLDRMTREGRLELDEDDGVVVYRVRGLSPRGGGGLGSIRDAAVGGLLKEHLGSSLGIGKSSRKSGPLPLSLRRKIPLGVLLGGLLPGLGLAYTAPWPIVVVSTLVVFIGFKVLAWISFLIAMPFLLAAAVLSAILGGLYTFQYNETGKRTPLSDDPDLKRRLPGRLKL